MKRTLTLAALIAAAGIIAPLTARADVSLTGAGATFPAPLYTKWASDYSKAHGDVHINYQGIGSGGGIKQITERTVDFGASDMPMTERQLKKADGIIHIPMTMGAVVPVYNLPGVSKTLVFSGPVLADIYAGKITKWNDGELTKLNPDANLPDRPITVVHRSDGSGTTFVWTDYLSKVSPAWKDGPGASTSIQWPTGRGAKGNDGVAADVKQSPGSIGYVELIYAANNGIAYGDVINADGKVCHATEDTVSAAAATLKEIPEDLRFSITNAPGPDAYPISTFTWILVYPQQSDEAKGKALADWLWWCEHDGQSQAAPMHYAPLPKAFIPKVEQKIEMLTHDGKPLHPAE